MSVRQAEGALELQASEAVVVHAASRILAALIRNGRLTEGNQATLLRFAVRLAFELAQETDRIVQSDAETGGSEVQIGAGAPVDGPSSVADILDLLD